MGIHLNVHIHLIYLQKLSPPAYHFLSIYPIVIISEISIPHIYVQFQLIFRKLAVKIPVKIKLPDSRIQIQSSHHRTQS